MKHIKEIVTNPVISPYRGSEATYEMVREQLREKYGDECADEFNPHTDAMPFVSWASFGYRIKPQERAFKSVTYVEVKNDKGEVERKIRRVVNLFHKNQVTKVR
ncbi:MAG: hypothetical protein WAX44_03330 [Minisyncoccia bacterium]